MLPFFNYARHKNSQPLQQTQVLLRFSRIEGNTILLKSVYGTFASYSIYQRFFFKNKRYYTIWLLL